MVDALYDPYTYAYLMAIFLVVGTVGGFIYGVVVPPKDDGKKKTASKPVAPKPVVNNQQQQQR
jgi:hypothetical protein